MNQQTLSPLETEERISKPKVRKKGRSAARRLIWLLVVGLLCIAAYLAYPRLRQIQIGSAQPAPAGRKGKGFGAIPVVAAKAQKGGIRVYFTGLGSVVPIQTVTVKSRVDGQLMKLLYSEGQIVHEGDLLLEIDPRPFQVQLAQAEGQLLKDEAALNNAKIDLARYQTLLAQNAIPQQQFATQQTTVAQFEGAVKIDQAQIESAKLNLVYCHIVSPITGRIGLRLVDPGNIVHANDANGLLVITQLEPISVIFTIAEDQLPAVAKKLRAGQHLRVEAWDRGAGGGNFADSKARLAQGTLTTLDNQIDQTTGTLKLRAVFDNKGGALFPNQFVNARLLVEERYGVVLVPNAAVQRNSQTTYVYVVKPDQTVTMRPVTVGTTEGGQTEVSSGLSPGEVVVTDGVDKLQEGGKVNARVDGGASRKAGS